MLNLHSFFSFLRFQEENPAGEGAADSAGNSADGANGGDGNGYPSLSELVDDPSLIPGTLADMALDFLPKIALALVIFIVGKMLARMISGAIGKVATRSTKDETLAKFIKSLAYIGLMLFVIIATIGSLGIDTSSLAALIAAAGLAIGFALQGSLGNFASGVMILMFRPFKVGDFVEGGGHAGVIEEIQVFATIMKTGDNKTIIIPNSAMTGGSITNYSTKPTRRIDMVVGISYDDDIKKAKDVLQRILKEEKRVLADPAPTIAVSELGDNSVNLVCRPWVNSGDYWPTHFDLTEKIKVTFDKEGLNFPYPQQDVHMYEMKS